MPLYENFLVPVCKNVGSRPYSSFGQESCKPNRTVGLYGGPRLPNLERFFKDRDDGGLSYKKLKVHKNHIPFGTVFWFCLYEPLPYHRLFLRIGRGYSGAAR